MRFRTSFDARVQPLVVRNITAFLERLPNGELLTTRELAERINYSQESLRNFTVASALAPYRVSETVYTNGRNVRTLLWGSKQTIKAWLKEQHRERS